MSSKVAVVTGAGGYVATHIIQVLVNRGGYEIRGTVRSIADSADLIEAFPTIKLYEADLLKEGSFDEVSHGATVIFHTASPVILDGVKPEDAKRLLVDPAIEGTLNVLRSAERSPSVKRVVLTSSAVAMVHSKEPKSGHVYTEDDWNEDSTIENDAYAYGKTLAEKAAWDFVKGGKHFDLVVTNPGFVFGPVLTKRDTQTSAFLIAGALKGYFFESGIPGLSYPTVDARDLGELHVVLAERQDAHGRHLICSDNGTPFLELIEVLRNSDKYSHYKLPTKYSGKVWDDSKYDTKKVHKDLGVTYRPLKETVLDTADSLIKFGLVQPIQA